MSRGSGSGASDAAAAGAATAGGAAGLQHQLTHPLPGKTTTTRVAFTFNVAPPLFPPPAPIASGTKQNHVSQPLGQSGALCAHSSCLRCVCFVVTIFTHHKFVTTLCRAQMLLFEKF